MLQTVQQDATDLVENNIEECVSEE